MTYSSGGLIQATDYNTFKDTLNAIWSTGTGNSGYGQTAVAAVTSAGTVTATQWSTLVNTMNSALAHQGLTTFTPSPTLTTGQIVTYNAGIAANITQTNTTKLSFGSQGTTSTGANNATALTAANGATAQTFTITRTATFASADQARYFFNAGGQINFVIGSATNNDATSRSGDIVTLTATNLASVLAFRQGSAGARTGTGGTLNTSTTTVGYYQLTTSFQTLCKITSTTASYTTDYVQLDVKSNGTQGANGDKGTVITFQLTIYSDVRTSPAFNQSINVTVNNRLDVVYPETTNLTNTWGSVTVA